MNSVLNDIKTDGLPSKSRDDIIATIKKITTNCSFILQLSESLPRNVDSVAALFDNVAAEIYVELLYATRK